MAGRSRSTLLRLVGDSESARRAAREVREELRVLGRERVRARVDVETRVAQVKIAEVESRLEKLRKQKPSAKVDVKIANAMVELDRLTLRLDRLKAKRVNIDVDVKRGAIERTAAGLGALDRGVDKAAKGFAGLFQSIPFIGSAIEGSLNGIFSVFNAAGNAVASVVSEAVTGLSKLAGTGGALAGPLSSAAGSLFSLGLSLAGIAAVGGAVVIALNAILGAIIALGGALVALVASLAAAAAGLGALAIGFGAALIPIVIVGLALFTRFQAVLKANQARTQELAQATQAHKTAEQQRKAAVDASRQAHEQLTQATVDGNRAMAQSVFDLRDAELSLEGSRLGVKEARLNLLEAKKALRDFRKESGLTGASLDNLFKRATDVTLDPAQQRAALGQIKSAAPSGTDPLELQRRILAVQQAQFGVKDAINQTAHAERALAQATQTRANFVRQGLNAYKPYRQALEQVRKADERAARAQDQSTAAQRKYEQALKKLSPTEQGTLGRLNSLISGFTKLAKALTDPVFKALNQVFDSLKGKAGLFEGALTQVGNAMAGVVRAIGGFLREPATLTAFQTLARGAASLVRELGARAFTSFLRIMREIAVTALPAVVGAAKSVADWLGRIASKPGRIHSAVKSLVSQFKAWAGFAGAVARLVIALFSVAAPQGKSLAGSLTQIVNRWTAWIKANPAKVRQFFRDAVQKTKDIVHWLIQTGLWLKDHLPRAAAKAKAAFEAIYPAVKKIVDAIKFVAENPIGGGANASGGGRSARSDLETPFKRANDPNVPKQTRADIALSLLALEISQNMRKALVKLLKQLGITYQQAVKRGYDGPKFASGGIVPGSGRGDTVPAWLSPGEGIIKSGITARLGESFINRLNAGQVPAVAVAAASGGDVHHHWTIHIPRPLDSTRDPDPENTVALIKQAIENQGGLLS